MNSDVKRWLKSEGKKFFRALGINGRLKILDFGCGAGYHAIPVAKALGPGGMVYAMDREMDELSKLAKEAQSEGLDNILALQISGEISICLASGSVDIVLLFDMLHYLTANERSSLYKEIQRVLKDQGLLLVYPKHVISDRPLWNLGDIELEELIDEIETGSFRLKKKSRKRLLHNLNCNQGVVLRFGKQEKQQAVPLNSKARREKAGIFFADEAGIRSDCHSDTTWAVKGQTPVVKTTGARFSVGMISAVNTRGYLRFMAIKGRLNSGVFIDFLKRLIHNAENPVYLVADNHPVHKSVKVQRFVESTKGKSRLFFLPPYSPGLNSDELVWNHVKNHRTGRKLIKGPDDPKAKVASCLRPVQRMPDKIIGFFKEPQVRYAAFYM